jgi:hypothetical protein
MSLMSWLIWSSSLATGSGVGGAVEEPAPAGEAGAEPVGAPLPDADEPEGLPAVL